MRATASIAYLFPSYQKLTVDTTIKNIEAKKPFQYTEKAFFYALDEAYIFVTFTAFIPRIPLSNSKETLSFSTISSTNPLTCVKYFSLFSMSMIKPNPLELSKKETFPFLTGSSSWKVFLFTNRNLNVFQFIFYLQFWIWRCIC